MKRIVSLMTVLGLNFSASAIVRTLEVDDKAMHPIWLKKGASSVIRFPEKPERVVVGNKNYFNIEFVGDDLAIQPQLDMITNLFVYGNRRVYGFILKPSPTLAYDDLVKVIWKPCPYQHKKPSINLIAPQGVKVSFSKVFRIEVSGLYIADALIRNTSNKAISFDRIGFRPRRRDVKIAQRVCLGDEIPPGSPRKCRLFLTLKSGQKGACTHGKNKRKHQRKTQHR